MKKKAGFRYVMDVIPLDADLIRGSHGRTGVLPEYQPVLVSDFQQEAGTILATEVYDVIWAALHK